MVLLAFHILYYLETTSLAEQWNDLQKILLLDRGASMVLWPQPEVYMGP